MTGVTSWSPLAVTHVIPGDKGVNAVTSLDDRVYVVRRDKKEVEIYDAATLTLVRRLPVPGISQSASGIAACSRNKCLYLSDWNDPSIHRVDLATDVTKKWRVAKGPLGLSVNRDYNLLVACRDDSKLQEYTTDGRLVREICLGATDLWWLAEYRPWHAIQLSSGDYLVSNPASPLKMFSHVISVVGADGRLRRSYSPPIFSIVGLVKYPGNLANTEYGDILVVDQSCNRILAINSSLTRVQRLPIPADVELQGPRALYLDETRDRLYIGEIGGKCRVIVLNNLSSVRLTREPE